MYWSKRGLSTAPNEAAESVFRDPSRSDRIHMTLAASHRGEMTGPRMKEGQIVAMSTASCLRGG